MWGDVDSVGVCAGETTRDEYAVEYGPGGDISRVCAPMARRRWFRGPRLCGDSVRGVRDRGTEWLGAAADALDGLEGRRQCQGGSGGMSGGAQHRSGTQVGWWRICVVGRIER